MPAHDSPQNIQLGPTNNCGEKYDFEKFSCLCFLKKSGLWKLIFPTVVGRTQLDILRPIVGRQFLGRLPPQNTPFWLNSPQNRLIHWQDPSCNSQLLYAENAGAPKNKKNEKTFFESLKIYTCFLHKLHHFKGKSS